MLMALYRALLAAGLLLSAPWWITRMLVTDRYREGFAERLGRVPQRLRDAVRGRRVVWLHAVSVGEVLAASRLVGELVSALNAQAQPAGHKPWTAVISTTTRTGQALARERFGVERVFYFPLDLRRAIRAYRHALQPELLILMESELWPGLLYDFFRAGIPVAVANARVSDRSFRRALRVRGLWARLLGKATLWLTQTPADAERLRTLGVPAGAVKVAGNLKYDVRAPRESRVAALIREAAAGRPILVAGSTTDDPTLSKAADEEQLVVKAWEGAVRQQHRALLVLAPRHPERFDLAYTVASEFPTLRATELLAGKPAPAAPEILLLDTIGDLAAVYAVADIAFVGGSLVQRGGHNPLEPAQFGVPVVMGPSFENFRDIVSRLQAADAIRIIEQHDTLEATMLTLLGNREAASALGERARQVFLEQGGATARTVEALLTLLELTPDVPALAPASACTGAGSEVVP